MKSPVMRTQEARKVSFSPGLVTSDLNTAPVARVDRQLPRARRVQMKLILNKCFSSNLKYNNDDNKILLVY